MTSDPAAADRRRDPCDDDAFDAFFADSYPSTVRLAHLLTGSNAAAEDLAQDAFARVYPRHETLDNPGGYLRTVTVNICRNWHRSRYREADRFRRHGASTLESSIETDELLDSIRRLPYEQQEVLVLRFWLDLPEADIARMLDCRPGTVKSRSSRALAALRHDIEADAPPRLDPETPDTPAHGTDR